MKRYWKLIGMALAIVLCVGTFYTNLALSESRLPSVVLHTQIGDEKELGDFAINGDYTSGNITHTLKIDRNGSHYINNNSIVSQTSNISHEPLELQTLQKNYRNFMRGKETTLDNFYIDHNVVIYGNIKDSSHNGIGPRDFSLDLAILYKREASHPTTHFSIPIPSNPDYIIVKDIQVVGNKVKIVTYSSTSSGGEIHLYTVDVSKQKLDGNKKLFAETESKTRANTNYEPLLQVVTNSDQTGPNDYMAALVNTSSTYHPKLVVVNLSTGEKEQVPLPKGIEKPASDENPSQEKVVLDGTKLEFLKTTEQGLTLLSYDMMTKEQGQPVNVEFPKQSKQPPITTFKNDKLYVITDSAQANEHVLILKNLITGETLYKGKIEGEKGKLKSGQSVLSLTNIDVR